MESLGWRQRRGSSPAARRGARQRAGLTAASASNTLLCERETLHQKPNQKYLDGDHGIYRDRPRCKRNLTFCEAFGCSHVSGLVWGFCCQAVSELGSFLLS